MRAFLSAVILWLFLGAPALAQSAACTVLSRMRLAEVALQGLAEGVGEGESHAALLLLIREVGPAGGLDPEFLAAFLSAHEGAVAALAGGARPETVLAGRALRETGARVARDLGLFGCAGPPGPSLYPGRGIVARDAVGAGAAGLDQPAPGAIPPASLALPGVTVEADTPTV